MQHWGARGGSGGDALALGRFDPTSWDPLALAFTFLRHKRLSHEKLRICWWKAQAWLPKMGSGSQRHSQGALGARGQRTFVPVLEGGHDEEADGLVGSLLEDGRGQALVGPL